MRSKRNTFFFAILMLCSLMFSGCTMQELFVAANDTDTEAADQMARSFLKTMKSGDMDALALLSTPRLATPEAREIIAETAKEMDKGAIVSIETIKSDIIRQYFSKTTRTLMGYQVELEEGWLKAVVVVDSVEGKEGSKVSTLYIEPIKGAMADIYAFDVLNAPTGNYIVLAITVCIPLFIIYTISICLRMRKVVKYRVLWIFFILVGVGTFSFDWSSGQMGFSLFSALMMGAGAYKDTVYGPWVLNFSFPVGAVAFYVYLSRKVEKQKPEGADQAASAKCELKG